MSGMHLARRVNPAAYERKNSLLRDGEWLEHLNGVEWFDADPPPRFHRCWPQSRAWTDNGLAERCACGSIRFDGHGPWIDRNTRKRPTAEERAERDRMKVIDALIEDYYAAEKSGDRDRCREILDELQLLDRD